MYIENPKTKNSGILCCIPQPGRCPVGCEDCFFNNGRSYLEPLEKNLPNMPSSDIGNGAVVRVNDGNDSNNNRKLVLESTQMYPLRFYNTAQIEDLAGYKEPVVLTVNPGKQTDEGFLKVWFPPKNLMYIRVRVNLWNTELVKRVVVFYAKERKVPVVLTFMAYYFSHPPALDYWIQRRYYVLTRRISNQYYCLTKQARREIVDVFDSPLVLECGDSRVAGGEFCRNCGVCLREFWATKARQKGCGDESPRGSS